MIQKRLGIVGLVYYVFSLVESAGILEFIERQYNTVTESSSEDADLPRFKS